MASLEAEFSRKLTDTERDWRRHLVLPFGSAYATAVDSFKSTIEEQKEQNKQDEADRERWFTLVTLALTVAGGSILLPVMANAAARAVAAKAAFAAGTGPKPDMIFKAVAFVSTNKSAEFAVGKLWDAGKDGITESTKKVFVESPHNYPSLKGLVDNPQVVQNHLDKYVADIAAHVSLTEKNIRESAVPDGEKTKSITELMQSSFFKAVPKDSLTEDQVAKDIELSFYCNLMMNSDFLNQGVYIPMTVRGDHAHGGEFKRTSRTSIDVSPTDPKYPKRDFNSKTYSEVDYKQYGKVIMKQYAELSKSQLNVQLRDLKVDMSQLRVAESSLNAMAMKNLKKIQLTLS